MKNASPIQSVNHPLFRHHNIDVFIKRDDLIHPIISGNKWRKLKYNLAQAKDGSYIGILSFGGSFSNHIHALAFACQQQKIKSVGIIRGEQSYANNFTLSWAKHWDMNLQFVDRKIYRLRNQAEYLTELQSEFPQYFIVPEGGSNALALPGVAEVINELNMQCEFDSLLTPVGSGGTLAGLITGDKNQHQLLGIAVLKQSEYLQAEVNQLLNFEAKQYNNWQILPEFHLGGYAKFSADDCRRIIEFSHITGLDFEPVYSGKMLLALLDLVAKGFFKAKQRIVMLHTGGLQGLGGLAEREIIHSSEWHVPPYPPVP
jgi:1-aminocyclopropane-1-carboxylate deaminase